MITATILDYGVGNLFSVRKALEKAGFDKIIVANTESQIAEADRLILPGVGAFSNGMMGLNAINSIEPIKEFSKSGKPLLGICLGMQMLGTESHEFGIHQGLNLIPGSTIKIAAKGSDGKSRKVPFVGWAELKFNKNFNHQPHILGNTSSGSSVYLVHSYHFVATDIKNILAYYQYGDTGITAAIQHENIIGLQFHPEKSSRVGLDILKHFISL